MERQQEASVFAAFDNTGALKRGALKRSLPPYILTWYLPGAVVAGSNVGAEIPLSGDIRVTHVAARAKGAPTSQCTVRLTANGSTVESATIQNGQTSGRSAVPANVAHRSAGEVLRCDVVTAGGAQDVTMTVSYTVASE
jgi:hypothetical protein